MTNLIERNFAIPSSVTVENRGGAAITVDFTRMNDEMIVALLYMGAKQKVNDAGSAAAKETFGDDAAWDDMSKAERAEWIKRNGKKIEANRDAMRLACARMIERNVWGTTRSTSNPIDPLAPYLRAAIMESIVAGRESGTKLSAAYDGIKDKDGVAQAKARRAFVGAVMTAHRDVFTARAAELKAVDDKAEPVTDIDVSALLA